MILSDVAIKRPVFTSMIIGSIILFGLISLKEIGIDLFPRVEFPVITVISVLPGADPATLETTVTDPIEEAVSTISGIKNLRSTSTDNLSQVIIEFQLEKSVDVAYQEVQARLGTIRSTLPVGLEDPVVEKFDIDSSPIMAVIVSGEQSVLGLTRLADKVVKTRLQRVQHVGQVKIVGGRDRQIWVLLDRLKLEGYNLDVQDVKRALQAKHVEFPGGRVETGANEFVVKTKAEFNTPEEINDLVVTYSNGAPIRIRDLGRVEDGLEEERSTAGLNGKKAVSLLVRRQSGTNTVKVANAVKAEIEKLRTELKAQGIELEIAQDLSVFIGHSIHEVQFHMVFGGGLAILIVLLFLRNLRSTFISSLVIPTSVIGTFIMMNALGFTQNMMTMLALSLSIGLLIDDAIVVQENIMRHVELGKPPKEAAAFATSEIALAVFATTISIVAVFVPVAFMKGIIGRFFYQFGLTVSFAVMISMFVSFTLDPMLSSRILKKPKEGPVYKFFEKIFLFIERIYTSILSFALHQKILVIVLAGLTMWGSLKVASKLRSEFIPLEDQSEFNIKVKASLGSSLSSTNTIMENIREKIKDQPWVEYIFETIGADELRRVNEGTIYVKMIEKDKRKIGQSEAMDFVREKVAGFSNVKISVEIVPRVSGGGRRSAEIQLELRGPDLDKLETISAAVMNKMREAGGYVDIDTTYEKGKPEINIYPRRDSESDMGVSPLAIASTVRALIGGEDIGKFRSEGNMYDISVRLQENFRSNPEDIKLLKIRNDKGQLISMQSLVNIKKEMGPLQIDRFNRSRQITIMANLQREKKVLGEAVTELTKVLEAQQLPPGYSYGFTGMADTMKESFGYLLFAMFLSVIIVYMVLASQFESFLHPLTIMMSLPLSIIGALGALYITKMTLSMFTMIGIIMLMGLVTKNAILLVDYTNILRIRDGLDVKAALMKAAPVRLRPILMTTLAMIAGMLPIAMGTGAGSESRAPMAVAVIGGLITSTFLTLIVIPVVYIIFNNLSTPKSWRIWGWMGLGKAKS